MLKYDWINWVHQIRLWVYHDYTYGHTKLCVAPVLMLHLFLTMLDPARAFSTLRERYGSGLAHISPSSSVCTNYTLAKEQYIKSVAHREGNHIHSNSFS